MIKTISKAQKEALKEKVIGRQIAENQLQDFVRYLKNEHELDDSWQVLNDLSGFEKPELKKVETPPK